MLGGGTSGVNAARMATGLGADVTILDVDLERMRFLDITMHSANTLYSSEAHLQELMPSVDLLIGAVLCVLVSVGLARFHAEAATYFRRADLVALPYRETDQSGVANTALAFGAPLILSDMGGFHEIGASTERRGCVPPGDVTALGATLGSCSRTRASGRACPRRPAGPRPGRIPGAGSPPSTERCTPELRTTRERPQGALWGSLGLIAYAHAGYPLVAACCSPRCARPAGRRAPARRRPSRGHPDRRRPRRGGRDRAQARDALALDYPPTAWR